MFHVSPASHRGLAFRFNSRDQYGYKRGYHRSKGVENNRVRGRLDEIKMQNETDGGETRWRGDCSVTTDRKGRSPHSYLEKPSHRCWWQTWSWGSGCCCPRCGTWPESPRSGARGNPHCSGTSNGRASEPRRCRGDTAGWRTACTRTPCLGWSLWSCVLEGTCTREEAKSEELRHL